MRTLKDLRVSKNLTQKELAKLFHVSPRTISNMEKNSANIKDSLLNKYINAFGVKYDEIFLGEEYEKIVFITKSKAEFIANFENNFTSKQPA